MDNSPDDETPLLTESGAEINQETLGRYTRLFGFTVGSSLTAETRFPLLSLSVVVGFFGTFPPSEMYSPASVLPTIQTCFYSTRPTDDSQR